MPLFSSSVKDSGHHKKLGKSPHARGASLTGRKPSIGTAAEDASTRAIAGSQSRLMHDDSNVTETNVKPMTPKSLNGDQMELNDIPPTPPPHDAGYERAAAYEEQGVEDTRRDSLRTNSTTTWRENPGIVSMRNGGGYNDTSTAHGMAESDLRTEGAAHDLTGDRLKDLAAARKKIQFAIDAELAADHALELARRAVDEARAMVGALEKQVNDELERAHSKKLQTDEMVRELGKLGRHNH